MTGVWREPRRIYPDERVSFPFRRWFPVADRMPGVTAVHVPMTQLGGDTLVWRAMCRSTELLDMRDRRDETDTYRCRRCVHILRQLGLWENAASPV